MGAGFSGIAMAIALKREGIEDFTVFERAGDVGGVWHHNTYPGAACDVPSYLYSYSYDQRRDWSQPCSPQAEILDYLRRHGAQARRDRPRADRHRGGERRVRRRQRALDAAHERRRAIRGRRAGGRLRPAQPAALARDPGIGRVRRTRVPLGRVGPRLRPRRKARGGDRHRRERDPVRAPGGRAGRAHGRLPAQRARTCCPATTASTRRRCGAPSGRSRVSRPRGATGCGRSWRRSWRGSRASARSAGCCAPGRTPFMRGTAERSRGAPQGIARLPVRLQADPVQLRLPARAPAAGRGAGDGRDQQHHEHRGGHRRRPRARGGLHRLRHRLPVQRLRGADAGDRRRAAPSSRRRGPREPRRTSGSRCPASRTCSCSTARTPTWAWGRSSS